MKLDPREARHVLRQCDFAALATQSARLAGYPFVSHVPVMLDEAGRPLMLLSALAEHSRNLLADGRASLMASPPGPDPQAQPRLTLVGDVVPVEADAGLRTRYQRYHPDAADYLGFGDFRFYRLTPLRVRLVGGFARAGWIDAVDWAGRPLPASDEAVVLERLAAQAAPGVELLGVDWEGLDLRTAAGRRRLGWEEDPATAEALAEVAAAALRRV